jgi:hypothetical protein
MKTRCFGVLVFCVALLLGAVACSGSGVAPNGMTSAEILEMSQNASMDTMQFNMVLETGIMGNVITMNMVGAGDNLNQEMYLVGTSPDMPDYDIKVYIVDDWLYMTDPNSNTEWIKTGLTEDIWSQQDITSQQLGLLSGCFKSQYLGMENINGINCYKIDVEPNWNAIFAVANISETEGLSQQDMIDMIKDTSCTAWVAENTYYTMEIFLSMTMEMEILGETYSMTMDTTMTTSNINQPVAITLPAAAENATVISYEDFMAGEW